MTAASPAHERRRSRPGSVERPVNARLYRGTWLLVGLPLLLLAFSVLRPPALQAPNLPAAFDARTAAAIALDLASGYPDRRPGTPGARAAASWFRGQLAPYGFRVHADRFTAAIRGRPTTLVNLVAEKRGIGTSPAEIVVMAHRDDSGVGNGLNDNASGTAALIELARSYSPHATAAAQRISLPYTLVFLSTDGADEGLRGAARFAAQAQGHGNVLAVLNLDAIGGRGSPRLVFAGDSPRSPAPGLVETVRAAIAQESGHQPARPSALEQLVGLAFPFSPYEQAPFVSRGIPAVTVTTARSRPPTAEPRGARRLDVAHLGVIGHAAQDTVDALEQGVSLAQGPTSYVFLGQRLVRGWAIEIVLVFMLLPFLAAAVDLFARCRRRRIRIAPALRSYRSRLGFWAWVGAVFLIFGALGFWGSRDGRAPSLSAVAWPGSALLALVFLAGAGWLVARVRLVPRRPARPEERLAGHSGALLALGVVGLLVAATNPFALVFVLPSLHAWLWLPHVQTRHPGWRAAVFAAGFLGPGYLVWTFATHYGLGWDAPWYLAKLFAVGYAPLPLFVIGLGWLAAAGQLAALASGRYAPYPPPQERPRRGPIRELIRSLVVAPRPRPGMARPRRTLHE
ncbi:MAG TPA: M28 family peptidase [Gaiellaceae bacterium]|nr:M28 family peptidase [Gaiellaceae bacterium]